MATLRVKRGDTLRIAGTYRPNGVAASLGGVTVACDMKRGTTVESLTCAVTGLDAGEFEAVLSATETANLPLGLWSSDVQFTDLDGNVTSTQTYTIEIVEDVTGAG